MTRRFPTPSLFVLAVLTSLFHVISPAEAAGPSFSCNQPKDALDHLTCSDSALLPTISTAVAGTVSCKVIGLKLTMADRVVLEQPVTAFEADTDIDRLGHQSDAPKARARP